MKIQCKNIPDARILEYLRTNGKCFVWDKLGPEIYSAFPQGTPNRVVMAKMRRLIERGLVSGCACGCRGDFELTEKGRKLLK